MSRVEYLDTVDAYDKWAKVYDSDGNFLQKLDDREMEVLLPQFLNTVKSGGLIKLIDLGCGTGRNTLKMIKYCMKQTTEYEILGLDPSEKMLDLAKERCRGNIDENTLVRRRFELYDILQAAGENDVPCKNGKADGLISTLVLEHVPADSFFKSVRHLCRMGGQVLITNMHAEMGQISQAGFNCPETGVKYRPKSYPHTVSNTLAAARANGFELVQHPLERKIDSADVDQLGPRSEKWVGVTVWFCILLERVS